MTNRLPATIATPAESTNCPSCDEYRFVDEIDDWVTTPTVGVRYEDLPNSFAHCPKCGRTDLIDTRSPFEALADALRLAQDETVAPEVRLGRWDFVEAIRKIADETSPAHCGDCMTWSVRVAVGSVR